MQECIRMNQWKMYLFLHFFTIIPSNYLAVWQSSTYICALEKPGVTSGKNLGEILSLSQFSLFPMAVKLRLQRKGRKKAPFYHIVVADSRSPRDGRFIEKIGTYNPLTVPATIELNLDAAFKWLMDGAEPTHTVNAILRFKGVLLRKHLAIGVRKGALTQEEADARLAAWVDGKDQMIQKQREAVKAAKAALTIKIDGVPKEKPKVEEPVAEAEENAEVTTETGEESATEETTAAE